MSSELRVLWSPEYLTRLWWPVALFSDVEMQQIPCIMYADMDPDVVGWIVCKPRQ